ncbi:MAG: class A beta-lactamase-related serine hydrolase [candidate division KSB1 bacterium]|nr:class A beta-lactamase-related serine hydrolase [candidate division KSB1 bacterium]MDZ7275713.1 class A beta-lactamase-related serine hydrolase [candidate division KSB1 bacterium]MDZ7284596.1 class A beta-lactamase-related serine hydrolase [candidate division KSB1 bacterium]MDZ7297985.1 class A beta-lactamase-related serine hydrolase [candidate division KSB1 bacterium]MDZ7305847.1 class A beta-lactamase-related serine hydrolase [candidate division KSB1 bacterium]
MPALSGCSRLHSFLPVPRKTAPCRTRATRPAAALRWRLLTGVLTLAVLQVAAASPARAVKEKTDAKLTARLQELIKDFKGEVGIYVRHLPSGRSAAIRADELFPTASLIKVPIMLTAFQKMHDGVLDYHADLVYRDSLYYAGDDILASFKAGEKIKFSKVIMLMITTSDNTASLWCQGLVGGGSEINDWLERHGFHQTRVNSRTPGREAEQKKFGWGQTTPREMAELLVTIREGRAVSPDASEEMYRTLTRIYWNGEALSQIPPTVQTASKQGAVNQSRSEVVLVNAPSGDYVFCLITKNQQDESWHYDNAGFVLIRRLSRLLWEYFEPRSKWRPAPAAQKWAK